MFKLLKNHGISSKPNLNCSFLNNKQYLLFNLAKIKKFLNLSKLVSL